MEVYIERYDNKIARLVMTDNGSDTWDNLMESFPESYDHIQEKMIIPGYMRPESWDKTFEPDDDLELAVWILGCEGDTINDGTVGPMSYHAQLDNNVSGRMWVDWGKNGDGTHLMQHVAIDIDDLRRLILGHDPIAEGWKDEDGNPLAPGNARRE